MEILVLWVPLGCRVYRVMLVEMEILDYKVPQAARGNVE